MDYPIYPCGDHAVTLQIGQEISEPVNRKVMTALHALDRAALPGVMELVPTYTSVCIHYDPNLLSFTALQEWIRQIPLHDSLQKDPLAGRTVEIPVCYGGDFGPDLEFVAQHNQITAAEVIHRHSAGEYLVYMLGFLPGFSYLGGMDPSISCPRLTSPRTRIPAGSVGIAGGQTGIYPLESPGGWQLIGRTPRKMFQIKEGQPQFTLSAGDRVRFVPIDAETFSRMEEEL